MSKPPPLPDEMKLGARHLRRIAQLFHEQAGSTTPLARPGSIAAADLADGSYDAAWGKATFEVVHEFSSHANYVYDHLHAMSAVITAPNTVLAVSSLSRTILEALAITSWLYEPSQDRRERVRRRYNVRLQSLREQYALLYGIIDDGTRPRTQEALDGITATLLAIINSARRFDFTVHKRPTRVPGLQPLRYLDAPIPSDQKLISAMLEAFTDTGGTVGPALHRLTSATAHAQNHGLMTFVMEARTAPDRPGSADVQIGLSLKHFSTLFTGVFIGVHVTTQRLCDYYGWPREPWDAVLRPAGRTLHEWITADP